MADEPGVFFATEAAPAVVTNARVFLLEVLNERFLSVNRGWVLVEDGSWLAQRRAEIIMRLEAILRGAHNNSSTEVVWSTPHQAEYDRPRRAHPENRESEEPRKKNLGAPLLWHVSFDCFGQVW